VRTSAPAEPPAPAALQRTQAVATMKQHLRRLTRHAAAPSPAGAAGPARTCCPASSRAPLYRAGCRPTQARARRSLRQLRLQGQRPAGPRMVAALLPVPASSQPAST
jgi:hypothetical protein